MFRTFSTFLRQHNPLSYRNLFILQSFSTGLAKALGFCRVIAIGRGLGASADLDLYFAIIVFSGLVFYILSDQLELVATRTKTFTPLATAGCTSVRSSVFWIAGIALCLFAIVIAIYLIFPAHFERSLPKNSGIDPLCLFLMLGPHLVLYPVTRYLIGLIRGQGYLLQMIFVDLAYSLLLFLFTVGSVFIYFKAGSDAIYGLCISQSLAQLVIALGLLLTLIFAKAKFSFALPRLIMVRESLQLSYIQWLLYSLTLIDRYFASSSETGGLAMLLYASGISFALRSLVNFDSLLLSRFSRSGSVRKDYERSLIGVGIISAPFTFFLLVFSTEIINLIYGSGALAAHQLSTTAFLLKLYGCGSLVFLITNVCLRILQNNNLLGQLYLPVLFVAACDFIFCFIVVPLVGLPAVLIGTILSFALLCIFMFYILRSSVPELRFKKALSTVALVFGINGMLALGFEWFHGVTLVQFLQLPGMISVFGLLFGSLNLFFLKKYVLKYE